MINKRYLISILASVALLASASADTYVVRKNDTFYGISKMLGIDINSLKNSNPKINPEKIFPGQVLNYTNQNKISNKESLKIIDYPSKNFGKGRKSNIEKIVLHSTEGERDGALNELTKEGGNSAHYLVCREGRIYRLVNDSDRAWHVGPKANGNSIGIELVGYAERNGFEFSDAQYNSSARLLKHLCNKYGLDKNDVVSHDWISKNIGGTNHKDPGKNFKWEKLWREYEKIK